MMWNATDVFVFVILHWKFRIVLQNLFKNMNIFDDKAFCKFISVFSVFVNKNHIKKTDTFQTAHVISERYVKKSNNIFSAA